MDNATDNASPAGTPLNITHNLKRQEESDDNESLESACTDSTEKKGKGNRKSGGHDWEIIEGLREGQRCEEKPEKFEGYMMKRRKWPMKGWHKRYFVLDNGILNYAKSPNDIQKGKLHGTVDIGLSVLTFKKNNRRIDIDADDLIYHLKVGRMKSNASLFDEWINKFRVHRLCRQHELTFGTKEAPKLTDVPTPVEDLTPITSPVSPSGTLSDRQRGSFKGRSMLMLERSQSKVTAWLMDSQGIDKCNKELTSAQGRIFELTGILEKLYQCSLASHTTGDDSMFESGQNSNSSTGSTTPGTPGTPGMVSLIPPDRIHLSSSNPNLLTEHETDRVRPTSMPDNWMTGGLDPKIQETKLREDFLTTAKSVHETLKTLTRAISTERERLKHTLEQEQGSSMHLNTSYVQSLKLALAESQKQNADYAARLARIHNESSVSVVTSPAEVGGESTTLTRDHPILTHTASWEGTSVSEFYDAAEYILSSQETSEVSDDDEASSDISDTENTAAQSCDDEGFAMAQLQNGRRSRLPAPRPEADISLWSLLCKNIGKDLSKISMPVTLNEPLNMLQRLTEELEYSELLDKAANTEDPYERMVLVAAFSVSPYAATYYRAGQKPFNPLLGETYECIREDKGWRFIAEQIGPDIFEVSHHPPMSACYADSKNFIFWQDVRIKTKFWGKSMEIQPVGHVNVQLPKYKDCYTWNKVTTCVHNLLGGQRWADHYGECIIKNENNGITCKLTFAKSSYWSEKRHEVYGTVFSPEGKTINHIFGKWNEGIYCGHAPSAKCIWRPGSMPEDYEMYYGFTRFAIELNEIDEEQTHLYASTDSRFRPDQRLLEEGKLQEAENAKMKLETAQRDRRKRREEESANYSPRWFMKDEENGKEVYRYTGKYWELRRDPGFMRMSLPKLW